MPCSVPTRPLTSTQWAFRVFGEHYVRTELFSKKDGALLSDLVIMRDNADYNCFFEADEENLKPYLEPTRSLIEKIKLYISQK